MKKPTQKELEQLENAKSTFKEIMKVHMREPFNDKETQLFLIILKNKKLKEFGSMIN